MFLSELCDVLDVPRPEPSGQERELNDYVFERAVRPRDRDGTTAPKRIDLYKKNAFILEAKQSRLPGKEKAIPGQLPLLADEPANLGKRSIARGWDVMMKNARQQAESYVFLLDSDHPAPPFVIVCDVGHCLELYADFTGTGRAYSHFPDRNGFRIYLQDLRDEKTRALLRRIWQEPHSLDPSKEAARVTRDIAKRLAQVSKALEERGCNAEDVAHFLMRCLFTMFAEDVELLPPDSFKALLRKSVADPAHFPHRLKALWQQMETGDEFSHVVETRVRHFNGGLFKDTTVFDLERRRSASCWRRRTTPGPRSIPRSSARFSNRPSTRQSAKNSARITRPAPMCSASWRRPSWNRYARIGRSPCARPSTRRRPATRGRPLRSSAPSTTSSAPRGCWILHAGPEIFSTSPSN
jgi:hypothetical protein